MRSYNIGDRIIDDKKDITIIDKKREKDKDGWYRTLYKYKCNKCSFDCENFYIAQNYIKEKYYSIYEIERTGCSCCTTKGGKSVMPNINSIAVTRPYLKNYFANEDDAYKYKEKSNQKVLIKCPFCETVKDMKVCDFTRMGMACPVCSTKTCSLGERMVYSVLSMLNEEFEKEPNNKTFDWCENYRYDFYLLKYNCIIETHGGQHYNKDFTGYSSGKTLNEQLEIDYKKYCLAMNNGIENYIIINGSETDFDYIKNSIINSGLFELLSVDKDKINWIEIGEKVFAHHIIKDLCTYWMNNENCSMKDLAKMFHISTSTVRKYLKIGSELNWCNYNEVGPHKINPYKFDTPNSSTPIKIDELNIYFKSDGLCSKYSEQIFGKFVSRSIIRHNLKGTAKSLQKQGYTISYVTREEFNEAINNGLTTYGSPFIL